MHRTSDAPTPRTAGQAVQQLRSALNGRVIAPGDAAYDAARAVFFAGFDRRPTAITKVADAADVATVIAVARELGLELAVRAGGHSMAGHSTSDGGIVLDLSGLRSLDVDPGARTAWADGGLTAGEYTAATSRHGLATGFGDSASVGIAGITLSGGVGLLHRHLGLTIDSLLAAEVVTADGRLVRTDAEREPDLFWALRGGGGNFGVVTRLKYRLHPVDAVVGGLLVLPADPGVLVRFIAELEAAPEALSGLVNVMVAPSTPLIPADHHGRFILMAMLVYAGDAGDGERAFAPFRSIVRPLVDLIRPMRFAEVYQHEEGPPAPAHLTVRSLFMDGFDQADAEALFDGLRAGTAAMNTVQFRVLGGAVARVPRDATAFAHRDKRMIGTLAAMHTEASDTAHHAEWAASVAAALGDGPGAGAYVGFLGEEGDARVRAAYPAATWDRLTRIKASYDPGNLFRLNQNIPPAGTGA
jgi:FAD/FMN-containing dehydrogenase